MVPAAAGAGVAAAAGGFIAKAAPLLSPALLPGIQVAAGGKAERVAMVTPRACRERELWVTAGPGAMELRGGGGGALSGRGFFNQSLAHPPAIPPVQGVWAAKGAGAECPS